MIYTTKQYVFITLLVTLLHVIGTSIAFLFVIDNNWLSFTGTIILLGLLTGPVMGKRWAHIIFEVKHK